MNDFHRGKCAWEKTTNDAASASTSAEMRSRCTVNESTRQAVPKSWIENQRLSFGDDQYEILDEADALLLITEWKQFRNPDFDAIRRKLRSPIIFDGRNQYDPKDVAAIGFEYYGIGRGRKPEAARA